MVDCPTVKGEWTYEAGEGWRDGEGKSVLEKHGMRALVNMKEGMTR